MLSLNFKPYLPNYPSTRRHKTLSRHNPSGDLSDYPSATRRNFILIPSISIALSAAAAAKAAEKLSEPSSPPPPPPTVEEKKKPVEEEVISRVYDASVIGEPQAVGKDKRKRVWDKLLSGRVVYLGEAELVPDKDDRELELEIVKGLSGRCLEAGRGVSVALEAFSCDLQEKLDMFLDRRFD